MIAKLVIIVNIFLSLKTVYTTITATFINASNARPLETCVPHGVQSAPQCDLCVALWLSRVVKFVTHSFPSSDAGTRDTVCLCWADVFMLLATLVRRDSSAAYPSVSAALGKRWRTFAGTQLLCSRVCVCVYVVMWVSKSDKMYYSGSGCRISFIIICFVLFLKMLQ